MPKPKKPIEKVGRNKFNVSAMETKKVTTGVLIVALVVLAGTTFYFYSQVNTLKTDPQKAAQEESKALIAKVGNLIVLPEGEEPTVATVTDPEVLKDQAFFAKAQKGDKVLIYANARKAILYSPSENKIIEVAPVNIGNPAAASQVPPQPATEQSSEGTPSAQ